MKPQSGIGYFLVGELSFIAAEIDGDDMHFNVISRGGAVVESGVIHPSVSSRFAPMRSWPVLAGVFGRP